MITLTDLKKSAEAVIGDPAERSNLPVWEWLKRSKMMSIAFPAGGSLYYTEDLERGAGTAYTPTRPGITLEDKRFCVGPDTSLPLWYGRRSQFDLDRGPCRPLPAFFILLP